MADVNVGSIRARMLLQLNDYRRSIRSAQGDARNLGRNTRRAANDINRAFERGVRSAQGYARAVGQAEGRSRGLSAELNRLRSLLGRQLAAGANLSSERIQALVGRMRTLRREVDSLNSASREISGGRGLLGSLSSLSRVGIAAGVGAGIAGLVRGIGRAASESIRLGAEIQNLEASFRAITGSADEAQRTIGFLRQESNRVGLEFTSVAESFRRFAAAAGDALTRTQVQRIFGQISGAARVLGLDNDRLRLSFLALQQMISRGTVSMEELRRQLAESFPGAVNIMARAIGVTVRQLLDMIQAGELASDRAVVAFANEVDRRFGAEVPRAAATATAEFNKMRNAIGDLGRAIAESGLLRLATELARSAAATARWAGSITQVTSNLEETARRLSDIRDEQRGIGRDATALAAQAFIGGGNIASPREVQALRRRQAELLRAISQDVGLQGQIQAPQFNQARARAAQERSINSLLEDQLENVNRIRNAVRGRERIAQFLEGLSPEVRGATDEIRSLEGQISNLQQGARQLLATGLFTFDSTEVRFFTDEIVRLSQRLRDMRDELQIIQSQTGGFQQSVAQLLGGAGEAEGLRAARAFEQQMEDIRAAQAQGFQESVGAFFDQGLAEEGQAAAQEFQQAFRDAAEGALRDIETPVDRIRREIEEIRNLSTSIDLQTGRTFLTDQQATTRIRQLRVELFRASEAGQALEAAASSISQAFQQSFQGVIQGTQTVSQAFQRMAQSILLSITSTAIQRGTNQLLSSLLQFGVGAIGGAAGGGTATTSVSGSSGVQFFANGGIVNRPTLGVVGDAGSRNPEFILNRPQMEAILRRSGSDSNVDVSVILSPSEADAKRLEAQNRAEGRRVVRHVVDEILQGRGSQVLNALANSSQ